MAEYYSIVIGIEKYFDKTIPKVDFAEKDAKDVSMALQKVGYDSSNQELLIGNNATKTIIEETFRRVCSKATEKDTILIYYAGHGFYKDGSNLLSCYDTISDSLATSTVELKSLIQVLESSDCTKIVLLLDCCHSGIKLSDLTRDQVDQFSSDALYRYKDEEFLVGLAACSTHEKSHSFVQLKNGVWTHFLLKALKGEVNEIYDEGILFADKLQPYLKEEVYEYVKLATTKKKSQKPISFGNATSRAIIADLNPLIREKELLLEKEKNARNLQFTDITMESLFFDRVRKLPGFKSSHTIYKEKTNATNNFVRRLGHDIIKDELDDVSNDLRKYFRLKRKDISSKIEDGMGELVTREFDYTISIEQDDSNPEYYSITRELINFEKSDWILTQEFGIVFAGKFNQLNFIAPSISVEELIDRVEEIDDPESIDVKYSPSDLGECELVVSGLPGSISVTNDRIIFKRKKLGSPKELVEECLMAKEILLENSISGLLE